MMGRIPGALLRAVLIAATIATPALLLTGPLSNGPEIIVFIALVAGIFVFSEYHTVFPSILEFRDAPPLNRLRFLAFAGTVVTLTLIAKNAIHSTEFTSALAGIGALVGHTLDFPYSPVRLLVLMLPADASADLFTSVRTAAGVGYAICLLAIIAFILAVRVKGWPTGNGAFNVWTNLPLFDPTAGGDVVDRLYTDARVNIIIGVLLPFIIPAAIKLSSGLIDPAGLADANVLVWTICAWAFMPASMIMRGIAMARIASLIEEKRRRAYAVAEAEGVQAA
ncbi:MAG: hypothetical protein HEP69_04625 [Aestuariivita sp.]|nr:hypothetical protein [Aestuariivita sp.]MCE8006296.1 hypothetical protein [Aestuariivita sp.]